jgi:8-oxo-dGTP pyrophosphatase MutT (NUDIX family)
MIEAAGGAVWRRTGKGTIKVLLVHRPRYDDWSLPKGKLDPGETARDAARREVEEETGLRCDVGPELATIRYDDLKGRAKRVRYWVMQPVAGAFAPNDEVDEVCWCNLDAAAERLSYDHDRTVLDALRQLLVPVG